MQRRHVGTAVYDPAVRGDVRNYEGFRILRLPSLRSSPAVQRSGPRVPGRGFHRLGRQRESLPEEKALIVARSDAPPPHEMVCAVARRDVLSPQRVSNDAGPCASRRGGDGHRNLYSFQRSYSTISSANAAHRTPIRHPSSRRLCGEKMVIFALRTMSLARVGSRLSAGILFVFVQRAQQVRYISWNA